MSMNEGKVTKSGIVYFEYPVGDEIFKMFVSSLPQRLKEEDETQKEYNARRKLNRGSLNRFKKGKMHWNPFVFGNNKGLEHNQRNHETVNAFIKQEKQKQKEESNEQSIEE
jgi:hypothetical protein